MHVKAHGTQRPRLIPDTIGNNDAAQWRLPNVSAVSTTEGRAWTGRQRTPVPVFATARGRLCVSTNRLKPTTPQAVKAPLGAQATEPWLDDRLALAELAPRPLHAVRAPGRPPQLVPHTPAARMCAVLHGGTVPDDDVTAMG